MLKVLETLFGIDEITKERIEIKISAGAAGFTYHIAKSSGLQQAIQDVFIVELDSKDVVVLNFNIGFSSETVVRVDRENFLRLQKYQSQPQCNSSIAIHPRTFYPEVSPIIESHRAIHLFSRQEQAFEHFDNIIRRGNKHGKRLKVFCFEGINTGVRKFFVADFIRYGSFHSFASNKLKCSL
jgi:hypothetical protein